jgi:hypothetical protein
MGSLLIAAATLGNVGNQFAIGLLALLGIIFIAYRQLRTRPVSLWLLLTVPLLLLFFALRGFNQLQTDAASMTQLVASVLIGIVFGYAACLGLRVYSDHETGEAVVQGTWAYVSWFILAVLARIIIAVVIHFTFHTQVITDSSWVIQLLSLAAFIGVRSVYLYIRTKSLGLPIAHRHHM